MYTVSLAALSFMGGVGFILFCGMCIHRTSLRGRLPLPSPDFIAIPEKQEKGVKRLVSTPFKDLKREKLYLTSKGVLRVRDIHPTLGLWYALNEKSSDWTKEGDMPKGINQFLPLEEDDVFPILFSQYKALKEIGLI
jgi:hypothetical protein